MLGSFIMYRTIRWARGKTWVLVAYRIMGWIQPMLRQLQSLGVYFGWRKTGLINEGNDLYRE